MPLSHASHLRSRLLYTLGLSRALLAIGCAAAQAPTGSGEAAPEAAASTTVEARCVTIERGVSGDVKDTRIESSHPDNSYGDLATTCAGAVQGKERLALLHFDLSPIPAGATVVRAKMSLRRAAASDAPFTVHRASAAWDERQVTWSSFGDAYDRKVEATLWTPADGSAMASVDITPLVRQWASGRSANHGVVLRPGEARGRLSLGTFFTSEAKDATDRPRLEVCYVPEGDPAAVL